LVLTATGFGLILAPDAANWTALRDVLVVKF
jgi:hypothetical protein